MIDQETYSDSWGALFQGLDDVREYIESLADQMAADGRTDREDSTCRLLMSTPT